MWLEMPVTSPLSSYSSWSITLPYQALSGSVCHPPEHMADFCEKCDTRNILQEGKGCLNMQEFGLTQSLHCRPETWALCCWVNLTEYPVQHHRACPSPGSCLLYALQEPLEKTLALFGVDTALGFSTGATQPVLLSGFPGAPGQHSLPVAM